MASVFCKSSTKQESILNLDIHQVSSQLKNEVISVLHIIKSIQVESENIDIVILGNPEILVDIRTSGKTSNISLILKTFFVCIILFLGAGLAIINFHQDVNMEESFKTIYYLVTGERNNSPLILEIPYSLGIGLGMAAFFNHFFRQKWKKEPSPLEVEMNSYQKNIDEYILDETKHIKNKS